MADPSDADAVALALAWLRGHAYAAELGGSSHISGLLEGPWPHLVVGPSPGGDLRRLRWDTQQEVALDVYDDPAGTLGRAALWRLMMHGAQALTEIDTQQFGPGEPVVVDCQPSGALLWAPLDTGQGRWQITLTLVVHPAP